MTAARLHSHASPALRCRRIQKTLRRYPRHLVRAAPTSAEIIEVQAEELEVALQERTKPMIIDFYADWCGPCVLLSKTLAEVADEIGDIVTIYKVNTDDNQDLASQLQIQGLPTMIFVGMDPEKPALRTEGLLPPATIIEIINTQLLASTDPTTNAPPLEAGPSA